MKVIIGGAWPYANGSLHIGHLAGLLPGDVLARYHRKKGDDVVYVSGSDCHGTPIALRARKEGVEPRQIADTYHKEFLETFQNLDFSYDIYNRTDDPFHHDFVRDIIKKIKQSGFVYEQESLEVYCNTCEQFLPDRLVEGECPKCGSVARGDQCDHCGSIFDGIEIKDPKCKTCGGGTTEKSTKHLYLALSKLETYIHNLSNQNQDVWRINAVNNTRRYLEEGLRDRAITRDLDYGIKLHYPGYESKSVYVWIEAVLGYLSASKKLLGPDLFETFWNEDSLYYYVHGKDNIPFHTIILPAILHVIGISNQQTRVVSSEYLTLEGKKISTSNDWAIWLPYLIERYHTDTIRYFLLVNNPEKRDADFSWREFVNSNNSELLGAWGNLVNRTLVFIQKHLGNKVPRISSNNVFTTEITELYTNVALEIEQGNIKKSIETVFDFIRNVNKYYDAKTPWITRTEDIEDCNQTIANCVYVIANLANILEIYIPKSSSIIHQWLDIQHPHWSVIDKITVTELPKLQILFERIDKKRIDEELEYLKQ